MQRLYTMDGAVEYVKDSLRKAEKFADMTDDCFGTIEDIRKRREELMDIITELQWRHGKDNVIFVFSKRKNCPAGSVPIEVLVETKTYAGRIYVHETEGITRAYIRF